MKINRHFCYTQAVVLLLFSCTVSGQINGSGRIKWEKEKISPGLRWIYSHTNLEDSLPQNINILRVNLNKRKISLVHNPSENVRTSIQADQAGAVAAINAGFFNVKTGGSVAYLKANGLIVDSDTAKRWPRNQNLNGAVLITASDGLFISVKMNNTWFDSLTVYRDVLVTGPLLVQNGNLCTMPGTSLVTSRHPRSAVGTIRNKKVVLVTIDGRDEQAAGMTLYELAALMRLLKCRDAVNLDGGGSTTMWIRGKPYNGVVNMPSDNKIWDQEGERAVANVLVVK
jgi:exopolysaccharide biosynthesis protein